MTENCLPSIPLYRLVDAPDLLCTWRTVLTTSLNFHVKFRADLQEQQKCDFFISLDACKKVKQSLTRDMLRSLQKNQHQRLQLRV